MCVGQKMSLNAQAYDANELSTTLLDQLKHLQLEVNGIEQKVHRRSGSR